MNIFKKKNNRYKRKTLRSYEEYTKDTYKFRVDEILEDISSNDKEYIKLVEESELLYNQLKSVLCEEDKEILLKYSDACWGRQGYSEQRLAEQVYEDLECV